MPFINPNMPARYWHSEGDAVVCDLCPHRCRLSPEQFGMCTSRKNLGGRMVAYNYGRVSSLAVDPVEKKPFFHYRPGTRAFSVGGIGCNLKCQFCQNYPISMSPIGKKRTTFKSAEDLAALCRQQGFDQIAFTYNEPSIWFEYIMDVHRADPGLHISLVTNGYIEEAPLRELCGAVEAMNIDVKAFRNGFYERVCKGDLDSVKRSCEVASEAGVHLELTYLVIPGLNDGQDEGREFADWVRDSLGPDTPVHFTRFHPDYNMLTVPMTPVQTVLGMQKTAEDEGLHYVYAGNIIHDGSTDTRCPGCGAVAVKRTGYLIDTSGMKDGKCARCGHDLNMVI